jgi:hypothetical protein
METAMTKPLNRPEIEKRRKQVAREIAAMMKPHLWESGYVGGPRVVPFGEKKPRLKLWVPMNKNGKPSNKSWALRHAFCIERIEGFTENGPIIDSGAGMIVDAAYLDFPVEDLLKLHDFVRFTILPFIKRDAAVKAAGSIQ